ncbi:MAG: HEAT repeat domain-containing protein [Thermoguttaceae bacterium]
MKNAVWKLCWIGLFITVAGCNLDLTPEPEKTHRAIAAAANELADALQGIRDADSARAATDKVDRKFASLCELVSQLPAAQREQPEQGDSSDVKTAAEAIESMRTAISRVRNESERLESLPGLPVEFWKTFDSRALDFALRAYEAAPPSQMDTVAEPQQFTRNAKILLDKVGYEEVVKVDFVKMRLDLANKACERLQQLAPTATLYEIKSQDALNVVLGPVKDFRALAAAIDFGDVVLQNEPKRLLKIKIHPLKLGARTETIEEEVELTRKENEEKSRKAQEEADERMGRARAEAEKRMAERQQEEEGGDPNDPAYYDRLAEMVTSDNFFKRDKAVRVLLRTSPSQVTPEQKKKIARAFKQLVEDDHASLREEAIKGLVIWGGKYSGPILLKMLEDSRPSEVEHVIKALGDIKYAKAAPALAAKLGDFFLGRHVAKALRQMGEEAEDALLVVAPTQNPDVCLAAVELLGDCGTVKSLPLLRKGATSRNWRVRDASKESIRKILARKNAAKTDDT